MSLKYAQTNTQYLAGSGVVVGATSIVLTSFNDIYGNALALTDFGSKGYGTLEPDTTNEEAFTFTSVTPNANGTVTLGGVSTALAKSPYTETSGLVRAHSGGTKLVISDNVAFWNTFGNKANDEVVTGQWSKTVAPVANNDIPNKAYVDGVVVAGASNANTTTKGIVEEATQAEVDAGTTTGGTGADLFARPDTLRSRLLSDYVIDTGAADAYVITPVPAITAYSTGQIFTFKAAHANTTTSTINVNGLGAKTIKKNGGANNLVAGDILLSQLVAIEYDGTNFQLLSSPATAKISQDSREVYATDSVGTDAYAITLTPAITAYATGQIFTFKAGTANTGAATLAVNGLTATAIVKKQNVALTTGDILANQIVQVVYDGTNFQMLSTQSLPFYGLSAAGQTTYDVSTASGTQNIPHGLGITPKLYQVALLFSPNQNATSQAISYNGNSIGTFRDGATGQTTATFLAELSSGNQSVAVITADATNIILTWTKTGSPTGTAQITWNAMA
jgi:hypothetical protein